MNLRYAWICALILVSTSFVRAQELPDAPSTVKAMQVDATKNAKPKGPGSYTARLGYFCGSGVSMNATQQSPTVGCGAGMTLVPIPIFLEFGVMGPQVNRSYMSGYMSVDGTVPLIRTKKNTEVQGLLGYTRFFETGHALDYGLSYSFPMPGSNKDSTGSMRIELRDYYTFANPDQHNIMLRLGWMFEEFD